MSLRTSPAYGLPQEGRTDETYMRADISPLLHPTRSTEATPSRALMSAMASPTSWACMRLSPSLCANPIAKTRRPRLERYCISPVDGQEVAPQPKPPDSPGLAQARSGLSLAPWTSRTGVLVPLFQPGAE